MILQFNSIDQTSRTPNILGNAKEDHRRKLGKCNERVDHNPAVNTNSPDQLLSDMSQGAIRRETDRTLSRRLTEG